MAAWVTILQTPPWEHSDCLLHKAYLQEFLTRQTTFDLPLKTTLNIFGRHLILTIMPALAPHLP